MNTTFIIIEPHYSDPDTLCTFTVGNGLCRASLDIYANDYHLNEFVKALESSPLESGWPEINFALTDDMCMNIGFTVYQTPNGKTVRATLVDVMNDTAPFRAEIDILLEESEAVSMARELRHWLGNPVCQFIWKK